MPIIKKPNEVRKIYKETGERGWVLPCFCTENLTTSEAILAAVKEFGDRHGVKDLPITVAITCRYDHRSQVTNYTHSRNADMGLKLFCADMEILCSEGSPYADLRVLTHLDHIQYNNDAALLNSDLSGFSSIMCDASALPMDENIAFTKAFVEKKKNEILIEGACDEIYDAGGQDHNELTKPEVAERYLKKTDVDLIVANLGTEHRANAKNLQYEGEAARKVKAAIGSNIVLHGTSSVPNSQVKNLYSDGVCKVNIWTSLERDSTPALFKEMVKNSVKVAGINAANELKDMGLLTEKAIEADGGNLAYFTTVYRQTIIFQEMKRLVTDYLEMWYTGL